MAEGEKAGESIILKRVNKGGDHAHHGGAWKLAYADFVTAMMAFFLLMWLLNVTSEEMKSGIAQYFAPESVSPSTSGSGDAFYGLTISVQSPMQAQTIGSATVIPIPEALRQGQGGAAAGESDRSKTTEQQKNAAGNADQSGGAANDSQTGGAADADQKGGRANADGAAAGATGPSQAAAAQASALRQEILENVQRAGIREMTGENLNVVATPEGVLIQVLDTPGIAMFEIGSSKLQPEALKFMTAIGEAIRPLDNEVAIFGHTDSRRFASTLYTNWELAADRANAARRVLLNGGVPESRIGEVVSRADHTPRNAADGYAPENRRIEILLRRK
jgi:chemotaxis protein MotB